ncbi:MAG: sulfatase [Prolixibacteraceae bacterium]|jgi:iduronate 2-sulfatase|nr:sulfatase [Prolixibacteraceae bacterium]MBT6765373.1 sulfatase [Prolixibacteraceae bacterium]MBT7000275.1 sulfatase [Prolixibacteraceae bacterium]MBT7394091.1 sulfatase [Prolixibacteraceae bacterium]
MLKSIAVVWIVACTFILSSCEKQTQKPNVLFIAVDDLRPELGCYGNKIIKSPNIDKLAGEGLVFNRTYCQQSICMASRASIMSGLRPDTLNIYNCAALNELAPDVLTINQHFENNGYKIWASGKIYHHGIDRKVQFGENFSTPKTEETGRGYLSEKALEIVDEYDSYYREHRNEPGGGRGPAFESPDVPDNAYHDGLMTDLAIEKFADFTSGDEPFFMAVGYKKPHLPFNAPKKYWDLYDADEIDMADNKYLPENVSQFFQYNFGELRNYAGIPKGQEAFSDTLSRNLKHGYYASVSYIDAQIGRLLDGLKENGLDENTIVILWGDHGWKLGEHGMWCKHTQFELDNHVPLILKVPGQKSKGAKTEALVEFVDIYPTLCDLAGLELPAHLQGTSFEPLVKNLEKEWKEGAISIWPLNRTNPEKLIMGYSVQTNRYRYTEWIKDSSGEILARDLFDHKSDPGENVNISNIPASEAIIKDLSKLLDKGDGWKNISAQIR